MIDLKDRRILVTGGHGFLGKWVVAALREKNADVWCPSHKNFDLLEPRGMDIQLMSNKVEIVIHLAAVVGGIGANMESPGRFFYENLQMGLNLIESSRLVGVKKFVQVGTICSYPKYCPTPFKEESIWDGYPEETNAPYGIAKKALMVMLQSYRQQYGFNGITLIPVNMYGPGDNFNPRSSHVIPALIKRFIEAKKQNLPKVTVWGTGKVTREFLHVKDAAEAIVIATEKYDKPEPINLGTSDEIFIDTLASMIGDYVGYEGKIVFDSLKPDGQPKRKVDASRAKRDLGWVSRISLESGLQQVIRSAMADPS
jgi:GDP-L-fucose synthase